MLNSRRAAQKKQSIPSDALLYQNWQENGTLDHHIRSSTISSLAPSTIFTPPPIHLMPTITKKLMKNKYYSLLLVLLMKVKYKAQQSPAILSIGSHVYQYCFFVKLKTFGRHSQLHVQHGFTHLQLILFVQFPGQIADFLFFCISWNVQLGSKYAPTVSAISNQRSANTTSTGSSLVIIPQCSVRYLSLKRPP